MQECEYLKALKEDNPIGFNWVYEQYFDIIHQYCLRIIRLNDWAEEACSEVFITLWKKREIINPEQSVKPLLYRMAKFTAYNYLKKISSVDRLKEKYLEHYSEQINLKNGEQLFIEQEDMQALNDMIDNLPPKRKEVFKLRYIEGMNNQAIAKKLRVSIFTVKAHLAKSREYFKENIPSSSQSSVGLIILLWILT